MFRRKSRKYTQEAVEVLASVAYEAGYLDGEDGTPLERGQLHVRPELVKLLPDEKLDE